MLDSSAPSEGWCETCQSGLLDHTDQSGVGSHEKSETLINGLTGARTQGFNDASWATWAVWRPIEV